MSAPFKPRTVADRDGDTARVEADGDVHLVLEVYGYAPTGARFTPSAAESLARMILAAAAHARSSK